MKHPTPATLAVLCICLLPPGAQAAGNDWPSYNRSLASDRHSPLSAINGINVKNLKVICSYDTGQTVGFQSGLIQAENALYGTTEQDVFSINPDTCKENWRVREEFPSTPLKVNRGVAYLDGRLFRGTPDGRVIAYDAKTGERLWATTIAAPSIGETVPAAPIAWNGMVFAGNAGGDNKGVKGRMYALDAASGSIVWEFFLVPRGADDIVRGPATAAAQGAIRATWHNAPDVPISGGATWVSYTLDAERGLLYIPVGNPAPDFIGELRGGDNLYTGSVVVLDAKSGVYQQHFQLIPGDVHDWDVSTPPALFTTRGGKRLMAVAPKDGHLYGYDLEAAERLYREPVTTVRNEMAPIVPAGTRFCPGTQGGGEWNGPAIDPEHNLVFTGAADWCTTVRSDAPARVKRTATGQPWSGSPDGFGKQDPRWAGWLVASDADSGKPIWRFKAEAPLMGGVTTTAGGLVLAGDMEGNFHAFESASGRKLWSQNLGGAIGGGTITYDNGGGQKIAVATGMTSPLWPTRKTTAKIVILGL